MVLENFFRSKNSLVDALTKRIQEGLGNSDQPRFFVSGGATPKLLFERLRDTDLPWNQMLIGLVDDRYVEPGNPASNLGLIRNHLLPNIFNGSLLSLYEEGLSAEQALPMLEEKVSAHIPPLDLVILGMGSDAHTASLFPGLPETKAALLPDASNTLAVTQPTTAPFDRITLTYSALSHAKNLILHIEGEEKRQVYEQAKLNHDFLASPISAFIHHPTLELEVYWAP